jgi:hypothetical protein
LPLRQFQEFYEAPWRYFTKSVTVFTCQQATSRANFPGISIKYDVREFHSNLLKLYHFPFSYFAAQPKEFFLDGLKKLEQRSHKCVELRGEYVE